MLFIQPQTHKLSPHTIEFPPQTQYPTVLPPMEPKGPLSPEAIHVQLFVLIHDGYEIHSRTACDQVCVCGLREDFLRLQEQVWRTDWLHLRIGRGMDGGSENLVCGELVVRRFEGERSSGSECRRNKLYRKITENFLHLLNVRLHYFQNTILP